MIMFSQELHNLIGLFSSDLDLCTKNQLCVRYAAKQTVWHTVKNNFSSSHQSYKFYVTCTLFWTNFSNNLVIVTLRIIAY